MRFIYSFNDQKYFTHTTAQLRQDTYDIKSLW